MKLTIALICFGLLTHMVYNIGTEGTEKSGYTDLDILRSDESCEAIFLSRYIAYSVHTNCIEHQTTICRSCILDAALFLRTLSPILTSYAISNRSFTVQSLIFEVRESLKLMNKVRNFINYEDGTLKSLLGDEEIYDIYVTLYWLAIDLGRMAHYTFSHECGAALQRSCITRVMHKPPAMVMINSYSEIVLPSL